MNKNNKKFLSGDEAVAQGAWEAGCHVAAAYPGTPSTEILEAVVTYPDIYCEWSTNEKVAYEVALGASMGGARALYASKHVGLNVAADPFFSSAYIGSRGGLVIVTADDPSMHSSQNEQDNRYYGIAAKVPVLSPSDSQECKDFTKLAFEISEKFNVPVIVRLTTRTSHANGVVVCEDRKPVPVKGYEKNIQKNLILPMFARKLHASLEERMLALKDYSDSAEINRIEKGTESTGIIADGVAYTYAKDAYPDAWFLKLGMMHPLPEKKVRELASKVKKIFIVEENDPVIETAVKALGISCIGKERVPRVLELNPDRLRAAFFDEEPEALDLGDMPGRPPALCPGCSHRPVFEILGRLRPIITGDIGCYTLGALPPFNAMDTCVDMGASITVAHGIRKALDQVKDENEKTKKIVAVIGDSTFYHSGMTGLANAVYNNAAITVVIMDNRITAMTGHQQHPGSGKTLMGKEAYEIDPQDVAKAFGVKHVWVVDPYDYAKTKEVLKQAIALEEPSVVITKRACPLYDRSIWKKPYWVNEDECIGCKTCIRLGCPAISFKAGEKKSYITPVLCTGCSVCAQVCPKGAIHAAEDKDN
ncbi:indolepyruvate ferredoxin oxidoreductase subunit alpha [candidate division WOR-3 bacterium]|nr:indolepyruvate ferredoxin oxidoreductase subunit alpha [candidate division WOR-3 bacterium]